jgi:NADH-quinone oxidoreductase subunit D
VVAAIDPCFSCTDRLIELRQDACAPRVMSWRSLKDYGIEWYRKRGVDFSDLNKKLAAKEIK